MNPAEREALQPPEPIQKEDEGIDVELPITEESAEESEAAEERPQEISNEAPMEEQPRRRKKSPPSERIRELNEKKKIAEYQRSILEEENQRLKRELEYKNSYASTILEEDLKLRASVAEAEYKKAVEEGDVDSQTKAQKYMIQFENQLDKLRSNPSNNNYDDEESSHSISNELGYAPRTAHNTYYEDFVIQNEWIDPDSPYYDPQMAYAADQFSIGLDNELKRSRNLHLKGTPEYFDIIADTIEKEFGIQQDQNYEEEYYPREKTKTREQPRSRPSEDYYEGPRQPVAPVNRTREGYTMNNTSNNKSSNVVRLSKEEREMALSMIYGEDMMTDDQKIKAYADAKRIRLQKGTLYKNHPA